ncbi:hypothetical protein NKG05_06920 [Oerskovia sp. M15]
MDLFNGKTISAPQQGCWRCRWHSRASPWHPRPRTHRLDHLDHLDRGRRAIRDPRRGKTLGFRHSHIDDTTRALIELGEENGFTVDVWDAPNSSAGWWVRVPGQPGLTMASTPFTSTENLEQYASIVFVSPVDNTNDLNPTRPRLLDDTELAAFQGTSTRAAASSDSMPRPTRCTPCPGTASSPGWRPLRQPPGAADRDHARREPGPPVDRVPPHRLGAVRRVVQLHAEPS